MNTADFDALSESEKKHFYQCRCGEMVDKPQLDDVLFHGTDHNPRPDIKYGGSLRIEKWSRTFTKSDRAKIIAASIWFPMPCRSVACSTASQTQSATQLSDTQASTAAHMMLWFAFTIQRATWFKRTRTRASSKSRKNCLDL
jgi:hypothetical protein